MKMQPAIPKRYKRKNTNGDLYQAFKIASDFDAEVSIITKKYLDFGYPIGFIKSVISDLKKRWKPANYTWLTVWKM